MIENKQLEDYRKPKMLIVSAQPIEVIASSPELDLSTTPYEDEEW